ncbi:hypothetical protein [Micromonospora carbonacea]|uniref:hypothetical protein n=1 Tax=Micromonospora carbonacea TaxID=47853 RepID=UPI0037142EF7
MVNDFGRRAQRDADHTHNVQHPTDNEPADLFSLLRDAASITPTPSTPGSTPAEEFEDFHQANPAVYAFLRHLARRWKRAKGDQHIGFPAIWETARYEIGLATTGEPYKLDNNARAFYCRLLMYREPELAGMFEIRKSEAADTWITELATREGRLAELPRLMGRASDDSLGRAA